MNVYKFLGSRDMAIHLKRLKYEFSTFERAFIVAADNYNTLSDKHAEWRELVANMPDEMIRDDDYLDEPTSLHKLILDQIEYDELLLRRFYKDETYVAYSYEFYFEKEKGWTNWGTPFYRSYKACKVPIEQDINLWERPTLIHITKRFILDESSENFDTRPEINLYVTPDFEVIDVCAQDLPEIYHRVTLHQALEYFELNLPIPFKKGDILTLNTGHWPPSPDQEKYFVFKGIRHEGVNAFDVYAVDGDGKIYETIIFKGYHCETLHGQPLPSEESPLIEMSKLIT